MIWENKNLAILFWSLKKSFGSILNQSWAYSGHQEVVTRRPKLLKNPERDRTIRPNVWVLFWLTFAKQERQILGERGDVPENEHQVMGKFVVYLVYSGKTFHACLTWSPHGFYWVNSSAHYSRRNPLLLSTNSWAGMHQRIIEGESCVTQLTRVNTWMHSWTGSIFIPTLVKEFQQTTRRRSTLRELSTS